MGMSSKSPPSCSTKGSPWSAAMTSRVTNYSRLQTDKWSACRQRMATTDLEQWRRWVRSYIVQADGKTYRRNRRHIIPVAEPLCNHNTHPLPSPSLQHTHPLRIQTHNTPHTQVASKDQIPNTCEKKKIIILLYYVIYIVKKQKIIFCYVIHIVILLNLMYLKRYFTGGNMKVLWIK